MGSLLCTTTWLVLTACSAQQQSDHTGEAIRLELVVTDAENKIRPDSPFPQHTTDSLQLSLAKNEAELGQIVLKSNQTSRAWSLSLDDLVSAKGDILKKEYIALYLAQYVKVKRPSDSIGQAGLWPDPLIPIPNSFDLRAKQLQSVFVRVNAPANVKAGTYKGTLLVKLETQTIKTLPIEIEIWPFSIPDKEKLPFLVGLDFEMISKHEKTPPESADFKKQILPSYYKALLANQSYPIFVHDAKPEYRYENGKTILNTQPFWQTLENTLGPSLAWAPIGIPFSESWPVNTKEFPLLSAEYQKRAQSYLSEIAADFEKRGALDRAFIYLASGDEPASLAQIKRIKQFSELIQRAHPRLKMLQTVHAQCKDCPGSAQAELNNDALLWAPNIAYYDGQAMQIPTSMMSGVKSIPSKWVKSTSNQNEKRNQSPTWWYLNAWTFLLNPSPRYPTLFIDHPSIEQRALGWQAFQHNIQGVGHWMATYWRNVNDPWQELPHGENNNGTAADGVLLFPNQGRPYQQKKNDAPITTLRLEMIREGAEDYGLLNLLKQKQGMNAAQAYTRDITQSLTEYSQEPEKYRQVRQQIALRLQSNSPNKQKGSREK